MTLIINSLRSGHTHRHTDTHIYRHTRRNNFKKTGVHRPVAGMPGLKSKIGSFPTSGTVLNAVKVSD